MDSLGEHGKEASSPTLLDKGAFATLGSWVGVDTKRADA